jgi:Galactose-1-phosphate uridyl transferase, N-terminal domain/GHMP kinases C terminal
MTWEERWHPLREEWVIVAAHRQDRPWSGSTVHKSAPALPPYVEDCYLCPGNVRVSGVVNPQYAQTYVFDNDHPCVSLNAPSAAEIPTGLYQNRPARGIARVVCYSPKHNLTLAELTIDEIQQLLRVWQKQYDELGRMPDINHVLIFENKGEVVGVSNPHPHWQAVTAVFDVNIEGRDKALLCQKVENLVVGAPCGVMDQMTAVFGERDRLLLLLCQPAELKRMITVPRQLMLWGIDSGIRHLVSGADYGSVRASTFAGLKMISELKGTKVDYLANISPAEFESEYLPKLPPAVRMPTAHPIYENVRVKRFVDLLDQFEAAGAQEMIFTELGELMYESHRSYTAVGLHSAGTDLIVELVRREGPGAGLFGAKITGGGSGGTVAVLGDQTSRAGIERVVASYARQTGHQPYVFNGSSSGTLAFGHLRLQTGASHPS